MTKEELLKAIQAIENIVQQDECADWERDLAFNKLATDKEKRMVEMIGKVYMIAHSYNEENCCHGVHDDWRVLPPLSR